MSHTHSKKSLICVHNVCAKWTLLVLTLLQEVIKDRHMCQLSAMLIKQINYEKTITDLHMNIIIIAIMSLSQATKSFSEGVPLNLL